MQLMEVGQFVGHRKRNIIGPYIAIPFVQCQRSNGGTWNMAPWLFYPSIQYIHVAFGMQFDGLE